MKLYCSNRRNLPKDARLHHNSQKLTHYLQESNQGRGFIKEVSFSPDGRIIASPFAYGIRLLAFNSDCRFKNRINYCIWNHINRLKCLFDVFIYILK